MAKLSFLISTFYLLLCSTAKAAQEPALELIPLQDGAGAVHVETQHLENISNSVLMAEAWLRNYILPFYPSTNVTTILVGHTVLCSQTLHHNLGFITPAVKNIHYSLTRWGLQNDIKATTSFSSDCLKSGSESYFKPDFKNHIKPLLTTLQEIGSPYVVNPPSAPYFHTSDLLKTHHELIKNLGVFDMSKVNMVIISPRTEKPTSRKLSSIDISNNIVPFPSPAEAKSPLPPLIGVISPMASPPSFGPHLPPCEPSRGGGGAHHHHGLWCVAKPSVPPETLQEALDFACGEGGADCEAIGENGSCYNPDTVIAHASYAFNSYWQKNKGSGGTCGFGGTAMLINSDPIIVIADSFLLKRGDAGCALPI
ncbi:hypothetical protein CASFOL_011599 [Castilleja foliolosa]|uniref:X8 domain-containing protein n=1 Tax=Castilleja foliolosa TaxID=1961234 RepID=A0ABD3E048_9LAMI